MTGSRQRAGETARTGPAGRPAAVLWSALYAGLLLLPLLVLASGLVVVPGGGWLFDFSMGLGFGALALFGGQFLLTARFRRATMPFGIDVLYLFHRWLAVIALGIAVAHYLILRLEYPATLRPASLLEAPLHMSAGRLALLLLAGLVASSLLRRRLRIEYDRWRVSHAALAVAGTALALVHVRGVGYYSDVFWTRTLLDVFAASLVAVVVHVRLVKPLLLLRRPWRVREVRPGRGRTWTVALEPEGHAGLPFRPGQFAWLWLGRSPLRAGEHPFSFSGSAEEPSRLELTIKELGDYTSTIGRTRPGTGAWLDGPHGIFTIDRHPDAAAFLFVAGGVGIAPIASMLRTMADRGDRRPVRLVYGTRAWADTPLRDELAELDGRLDLERIHVLEEPHEGWTGATGRPAPELLASALEGLPAPVHAFLCGPPGLNRRAERALARAGLRLGNIHVELFEMA